ncbi:Protein phosphatase ppm-1 [Schistosoma japonicum]|uniref:Protein phosphatase ppm-1 n=1 Tax=Schistosoma japonicum TaxID=6182 RepID=A0A4Z2D1C8_SCHJA|nr:Protein phosphatase ppm-1 [Schistosoma japonicum]
MKGAYVVKSELPSPFQDWSYFGVFDVYAGSNAILDTEKFQNLNLHKELDSTLAKRGIVNGFLRFDRDLIADDYDEKSSSKAVVAFVTPTKMIMSNYGLFKSVTCLR